MNHKAKEEKVVKKGRKTTKKSAKNTKRLIVAALVIAAMAIIATGAVISRQSAAVKTDSGKQPSAPAAAANSKYVTVRVAGRDLQVDSQTGRLKPLSQEEAQRLAESLKQNLNRSTEGLVAVEQPDGSQTVDLQGRFENVMVAKVNEDGTVSQSCVDNVEAASAFFGIDPQLVGAQPSAAVTIAKQPTSAKPTKD